MRHIVFNSKGDVHFGVRVAGFNSYAAPGRQVQGYTIPGRAGEFFPAGDVGVIPNMIREYELALYRDSSYESTLQQIRNWLLTPNDYCKLMDSYETGLFYMARFTGDVVPERRGAGNNFVIPIKFSCMPQRFLDSGETWVEFETGEGVLYLNNQTPNNAYPLAYVANERNEELTLSLWDEDAQMARASMTIDAYSQCYFDFETTNAYVIDLSTGRMIPQNDLITAISGDWEIHPGVNLLKRSSNELGVTLKPRWWVR